MRPSVPCFELLYPYESGERQGLCFAVVAPI